MYATGTVLPTDETSSLTITNSHPLIFMTATRVGIHLTAGEGQINPNFLLGYRRSEAVTIPVPDPALEVRPVYADILINSSANTNATSIATNFSAVNGVFIKQSFATGRAAEALARDATVQGKLNRAAGTTVGKIERLRLRGNELAQEVSNQINRLGENQLPAAGDAVRASGLGLFTDTEMTQFENANAFKQSSFLRDVAANNRSTEADIAKVEKYLVLLREIK